MKKTPESLRAEAALLERYASEAIVKANQLKLNAKRLEEEQREQREAREAANAELVKMFFLYRTQLKLVH